MSHLLRGLNLVNDFLWGYLLIALLVGCAIYFTIRSRFVQFRMFKEMLTLLTESSRKDAQHEISSFQAFAISLASRVGTGNLAGVASAIVVGGPGAVFWMWLIALLGASTAFVESTLAQLYKVKGPHSFMGGPAYYMKYGLKRQWMGVLFAVLITLTFSFSYNFMQSNTICAALYDAYQFPPLYVGLALTALTALIIFGGVQRIAKASSVIVPPMAIGYVILAIVVVALRIQEVPAVIRLIMDHAFGWQQVAGGGMGAAVMQGIKRGLFSNEAGEGSAPNAAATATVSHPVKQGLIQSLGVFTDTLLICSCTAFIILFSNVPLDGTLDGINLTQHALHNEIGNAGYYFITISILFFAFSSVLGNYYYGEANVMFVTHRRWALLTYRYLCCLFVLFGALTSLEFAWGVVDLMMALITLCNLTAIIQLSPKAFRLEDDYLKQKRAGIKSPVFTKDVLPPNEQEDINCW